MPSCVSGTIYRFCWGLLLGSKGPQGGVREPQGPMPPHRVLGSGSRKFLFTCDFPPGITSHNPTFSNIKVFRSPLRNCSGGVHASPIIILFLQWASCSRGTPTTQLKPHWRFPRRAFEAHDFQYHQQEIPHPTLNPGNPREAFQDCFTARCWNGLRLNSKRIIFFPFQAGQAVFGMLTSTEAAALHTFLSPG